MFVPELCLSCRRPCPPGRFICHDCFEEIDAAGPLEADPPGGVGRLTCCAPHEGVARSLLAAFKFDRLPEAGRLIAAMMASAIGRGYAGSMVVAVPASRVRRWWRGFDSAEVIAGEIVSRVQCQGLDKESLRRVGMGRQRGRGRSGRLALPPDVRCDREVSGSLLLVDDVATTGATLAACSEALHSAGAKSVDAVTFTRRL